MFNPFRYFKTSPEGIRLAVMLYVRPRLSVRKVKNPVKLTLCRIRPFTKDPLFQSLATIRISPSDRGLLTVLGTFQYAMSSAG